MALDLGSTRFKLALLDARGQLYDIRAVPAPALTGDDLIREGDADEFLRGTATDLLRSVPAEAAGIPLGLVCQRSTFTAWEKHSGKAVLPMVSWQDRRAEQWCNEHFALDDLVQKYAGLRLSPHYMGPKLADMQAEDPALAGKLAVRRFPGGQSRCMVAMELDSGKGPPDGFVDGCANCVTGYRKRRLVGTAFRQFSGSPCGVAAVGANKLRHTVAG